MVSPSGASMTIFGEAAVTLLTAASPGFEFTRVLLTKGVISIIRYDQGTVTFALMYSFPWWLLR